ncbi:hypothetical protein [Afipia felis]|uniref:Uncharacterized protein n=2 Tax=Afipia felis TaxID=1035 RepID=A0A381AYN1_AFIFE|nr:hypothetical protein [Afipia felis]EKS26734.1 hypothetical protein HMPREF9697_03992 [Afipia felis ATCC 53690]SUU76175.1 Uncharacterised protein [Afipia felis]SUU84242.1 Uncharacterised protein [Afipia felis]SUW28267.1 Uncharacterised protein [Afipia felis]
MTVGIESPYVEVIYDGSQSEFASLFRALDSADVHVGWLDDDGLPVWLTSPIHFTASLVSGMAVVQRVAFPEASPVSPLTLVFERITPPVQAVDFTNLGRFDPKVHERLADASAMRDAELRSKQARTPTPFAVSDLVVDFRPRRVKAADPLDPEDLVTKSYSDLHTGTAGAERAEAAADRADADAAQTAADREAAEIASAAAVTAAHILGMPDDGFYNEATDTTIDDGIYA